MSHPEPIIRHLGDAYVSIEFSDRFELVENLRVHRLARVLEESSIKGVVEVVASLRSLAVVLDRTATTPRTIEEAIREALGHLDEVTTLRSRLFELPVWYDDPWSKRIAEIYEVQDNLELVAEANGIDVQEAIARHTGTDFWVAAVGFVPGCFWSVALDESKALTAPKYRVPRDRTPSRAVALAGVTTTIYPYPGPGGYQCIGRCAVNVYELGSSNPLFPADGVLVRPGDRHRYVAVDPFEYEETWERVQAGTYEYRVNEEEFDVSSLQGAEDVALPVEETA